LSHRQDSPIQRVDDNVRRRLLVKAAEKANVRLVKLGIEPIGTISPHSLRRTNATLRSLVGEPAKRAAKEMGHVSSRLTFDVYEQATDLREWLHGAELAEFDRAIEWAQWAQLGTNGIVAAPVGAVSDNGEQREAAAQGDSV
jgi:integrase